jgi:DNA-binding NarL/FixJ family response regulator
VFGLRVAISRETTGGRAKIGPSFNAWRTARGRPPFEIGRSLSVVRRATVLLADDHTILAEGLVGLLKDRFDVVGTVGDGPALIEAAQRLRPDVIVADLTMPGMSGLEAVERVKQRGVKSRIVILTMHGEAMIAARAMRAGASAFLLKQSAGEELLTAIEEVLQGRKYITPAVTNDVIEALQRHADEARIELTPRQLDVLRLIVEGQRMKEIASTLGVSPRTVETHKYEMMRTLGAQSTAELVRYAIEHKLL